MLVTQLCKDQRLKKICNIEASELAYGIAVLSRFRTKVGPERLSRVVDHAVEVLVKQGRIKGEAVALDSTFIKAYSRRNLDNLTGCSRILNIAADARSELPLVVLLHRATTTRRSTLQHSFTNP